MILAPVRAGAGTIRPASSIVRRRHRIHESERDEQSRQFD
jgi:hypothetical protein